MKTCQNCGKQLEDSDAFCDQCGTPAATVEPEAPAAPICSGCDSQLEERAAFCQNCGAPVAAFGKQTGSAETHEPVEASRRPFGAAYLPAGEPKAEKAAFLKSLPTKYLLIAATAVVVIAAVLIAIFVLRPVSKSTLVYLKDEELSMSDLKNFEPFELTEGLFDDDSNYMGYTASYYVRSSEDGRYLFYPEDIKDDYTFDLYMIDLKANNEKNSTAHKIGNGISDYEISLDGKKIYYLDNDKLYFTDLNEKTKIDSDVSQFVISDDGTKLLYIDMDDKLYYSDFKSDGDVEKLDSDADIRHVSDDLSEIYYLKDDTLYYLEIGKDKVKIDSKVSTIIAVYDTGEVYYVINDSDEVPLMDFVNDDMAAADAGTTEPNYDDFRTEVTNSNGSTYEKVDYDAYYEAYDAYYEKQDRDELREELKSETYTVTKSSLFYYDGTESVEITDSYSTTLSAGSKAMIAYGKINTGDLPTMKLSEIEWTYDVEYMLDDALSSGGSGLFIAVGAVESEISQENASSFVFNQSCSALYFLDNYSERDDSSELYAVQITGDTLASPELYDEDVSRIRQTYEADTIAYFKDFDYDDYTGDLYVNKTAVDTDVSWYDFRVVDEQLYYYLTDVDDDGVGTLKVYDGKKPAKIADDVYSFITNGDSNVAYLSDYDVEDSEGEAYLYNGAKEPKLIDRDVAQLIMIS